MQTWDLYERAVEFDGRRLPHKTAPFSGDRYCIVVYNPDFSFHDRYMTHAHERSEELRAMAIAPPSEIARVSTDEQKGASANLLRELQQSRWVSRSGKKSHEKYAGGDSHTLVFGKTRTRAAYEGKSKARDAPANKTHRPLLLALQLYLRALIGPRVDEYTGLFVAHNSTSSWHFDRSNVGPSIITCIGEYEGGALLINPEKRRMLPCYKCKTGNQGARMCREVKMHITPEWWCGE